MAWLAKNPYYKLQVRIAFRAKAFELYALVTDNKTLVRAFYHRNRNLCQTVCVPTIHTGKMRVALVLGAIVCQFEMPGPFLQKCLMDNAGSQKAFECAINRDLIRTGSGKLRGNLVCRLWFVSAEQNLENSFSGLSSTQVGGTEQNLDFLLNLGFHSQPPDCLCKCGWLCRA